VTDTNRELLETRARALARVPADELRAGERIELVVFVLAGERYGIESRFVREVLRLTRYTPVPGTPPFVIGITSLRGEILALFDLRQLLGVTPVGVTDLSRIVVLGEHRREFGVLADAASEVVLIASDDIVKTGTAWSRTYLQGVTPDGVVVLSGEALLSDPRLSLEAGAQGDKTS
jgi:purine-binding chemotaxis protein CheW